MLCPRETHSIQLQPTPAKIDANPGEIFGNDYGCFTAEGNGLRLQIHLAQEGLEAGVGAQAIPLGTHTKVYDPSIVNFRALSPI